MNSTVDELVMHVCTSSQAEQDLVRAHVEALDRNDHRFSSVALKLITEHQHGLARSYVVSALRAWLANEETFESALIIAEHRTKQYRMFYSAALVVIEDAIAAKSIIPMTVPADYTRGSLSRAASNGHFHLIPIESVNRPDLMEATYEELNNYFRPIAVAGVLLNIGTEAPRFVEEAPAFLTWIAAQPNIDEMLAAALRTKSLDPATLEDMVSMCKTTPQSLYDGLI